MHARNLILRPFPCPWPPPCPAPPAPFRSAPPRPPRVRGGLGHAPRPRLTMIDWLASRRDELQQRREPPFFLGRPRCPCATYWRTPAAAPGPGARAAVPASIEGTRLGGGRRPAGWWRGEGGARTSPAGLGGAGRSCTRRAGGLGPTPTSPTTRRAVDPGRTTAGRGRDQADSDAAASWGAARWWIGGGVGRGLAGGWRPLRGATHACDE